MCRVSKTEESAIPVYGSQKNLTGSISGLEMYIDKNNALIFYHTSKLGNH
jgi:hypothetical protein